MIAKTYTIKAKINGRNSGKLGNDLPYFFF